MITLINGHIQNQSGLAVPNGSVSFQLNVDATIVAAPYGIIPAELEVVFQFDANGDILPNDPDPAAQIYSNQELNPQNMTGLGTYYQVTFYDQNGARINKVPMWWQFTEVANSTVDIGQVRPYATSGGNIIFYPTNLNGVTSVSFTGDGVVFVPTPGTPVTTVGTLTPILNLQHPHFFLAGPASGSSDATPTFRAITAADVSGVATVGGSDTDVQFNDSGSFGGNSGFTYNKSTFAVQLLGSETLLNSMAATNITPQDSPSLLFSHNWWNGSASVNDTWTIVATTSGVFGGAIPALSLSDNIGSGQSVILIPKNLWIGTTLLLALAVPVEWAGAGSISMNTADSGQLLLHNNNSTGDTAIVFGVNSDPIDTHPGLFSYDGDLNFHVRLGDDSADTGIYAAQLRLSGEVPASTIPLYIVQLGTGPTGLDNAAIFITDGVTPGVGTSFQTAGNSFRLRNDSGVGSTHGDLSFDSGGFHLNGGFGSPSFHLWVGPVSGGYTGIPDSSAQIDLNGVTLLAITANPGSGDKGEILLNPSADLITFYGNVSGNAAIGVSTTAGTPNPIILPLTTGGSGGLLTTDGGSPQQTSWTLTPSLTSVTLGPVTKHSLKVNISSAQLKAFPGTPVQLVAAAGTNKLIIVDSAVLQYRFVSTPYTVANVDNEFSIVYHGFTNPMGTFIPTTGLVDQTANTLAWLTWENFLTPTPQTQAVNLAIDLTLTGTTPGLTLGDGTLEVVLEYTVVDLS